MIFPTLPADMIKSVPDNAAKAFRLVSRIGMIYNRDNTASQAFCCAYLA
jgi:hypothetical protein